MRISIALRKVTKNISLIPKEKVMENPFCATKKVDKFALSTLVETVRKNEIFGDNLAFYQWF